MNAELKLLARILVHERGAVHCVALDLGRERNRAHDLRVMALRRFYDLVRGTVREPMIVGLDPDTHFLRYFSFFLLRHGISH